MSNAHLVNVPRDAQAKLLTASGTEFTGADETPFDTAEEACAAAVQARDTGEYQMIRVWIEGPGMIDFPQIEDLHQYWTENPA